MLKNIFPGFHSHCGFIKLCVNQRSQHNEQCNSWVSTSYPCVQGSIHLFFFNTVSVKVSKRLAYRESLGHWHIVQHSLPFEFFCPINLTELAEVPLTGKRQIVTVIPITGQY